MPTASLIYDMFEKCLGLHLEKCFILFTSTISQNEFLYYYRQLDRPLAFFLFYASFSPHISFSFLIASYAYLPLISPRRIFDATISRLTLLAIHGSKACCQQRMLYNYCRSRVYSARVRRAQRRLLGLLAPRSLHIHHRIRCHTLSTPATSPYRIIYARPLSAMAHRRAPRSAFLGSLPYLPSRLPEPSLLFFIIEMGL